MAGGMLSVSETFILLQVGECFDAPYDIDDHGIVSQMGETAGRIPFPRPLGPAIYIKFVQMTIPLQIKVSPVSLSMSPSSTSNFLEYMAPVPICPHK